MTRPRLVHIALAAILGAPVCGAQAPARAGGDATWPVKAREHTDLWWHGFAMVSEDASQVPLFRRGYADSLHAVRRAAAATTDLDANRAYLAQALATDPALVNAQFLPLYFGSWADMDDAVETFLTAAESGKRARDDGEGRLAAVGGVFGTKVAREFARRLLLSLRSERDRFFHEWWLAEMRRREPVIARVDSLWRTTYAPALRPFLARTQQRDGDFVLSLVLEGEGRTAAAGPRRATVAVGLPLTTARAEDAIFAFAHEVVGTLVAAAIADNLSPAEKRSGVPALLSSAATVRAGALLLAHVGDGAAERYQRFYLRLAGVDAGAEVGAAFARTFALPEPVLESIGRQIAVTFGGI